MKAYSIVAEVKNSKAPFVLNGDGVFTQRGNAAGFTTLAEAKDALEAAMPQFKDSMGGRAVIQKSYVDDFGDFLGATDVFEKSF